MENGTKSKQQFKFPFCALFYIITLLKQNSQSKKTLILQNIWDNKPLTHFTYQLSLILKRIVHTFRK